MALSHSSRVSCPKLTSFLGDLDGEPDDEEDAPLNGDPDCLEDMIVVSLV